MPPQNRATSWNFACVFATTEPVVAHAVAAEAQRSGGGSGHAHPDYPPLLRAQRLSYALPMVMRDIAPANGRQVRRPLGTLSMWTGRASYLGLVYIRGCV